MLIGYDTFKTSFKTINSVNGFYKMEIKNCKVDEIHIFDSIDIAYNSEKSDWDYYTIFQARFQNTLEAGNIDNKGIPIEYLKFRKREVDTLEWRDIAIIPYDKLVQVYEYIDRFVKSTEEYEYAVLPMTANVTGKPTTDKILCDFDGVWLVGKNQQYKLEYDLQQGDFENTTQSTIIETLGGQYPITHHSQLDYTKGSIEAKVLSDETMRTFKIDKRQERIARENLFKFMKDRKPKILKTGSGKMLLVSLMNFRERPVNELEGNIANVSFDFVEIGNSTNQDDLKNSGLIDVTQTV